MQLYGAAAKRPNSIRPRARAYATSGGLPVRALFSLGATTAGWCGCDTALPLTERRGRGGLAPLDFRFWGALHGALRFYRGRGVTRPRGRLRGRKGGYCFTESHVTKPHLAGGSIYHTTTARFRISWTTRGLYVPSPSPLPRPPAPRRSASSKARSSMSLLPPAAVA